MTLISTLREIHCGVHFHSPTPHPVGCGVESGELSLPQWFHSRLWTLWKPTYGLQPKFVGATA